MNLRGIANAVTSAINPNTAGTITFAGGSYTVTADGRRTQAQQAPAVATMQVQALTTKDIAHLDSMNIGGSTHAVIVNGRLEALVRPENKGGDILNFNGQVWLVTAVLEDWDTWTRVAVTLQNGA